MTQHDPQPEYAPASRLAVIATVIMLAGLLVVFTVIFLAARATLNGSNDKIAILHPEPIPTASNLTSPRIHAVWVPSTDPALNSKASLEAMFTEAKAAGINTVFIQASWRYATNYPSPTLYQAKYPGRDVLQEALTIGHEHDIAVHAWYTVLVGGQPDSPNPLWQAHGSGAPDAAQRWTLQSINNSPTDFLDPSIPEVRTLAIATGVELALHGAPRPDGVHLDFIRFPEDVTAGSGSEWGYGPKTLSAYRQANPGVLLPGEVPRTDDPEFLAFKCDLVTSLATEITQHIKAASPQTIVSAAVVTWGNGPKTLKAFDTTTAVTDVSQCWNTWAATGAVDMLVPMAYFNETKHSTYDKNWIDYMARLRGTYPNTKIVVGHGPYLNDTQGTLTQIQRGANTLDGYALYSWQAVHEDEILRQSMAGGK